MEVIANVGSEQVQVEEVSLVSAHGVTEGGVVTTPIIDKTLIGTTYGWPPNSVRSDPDVAAAWERRTRIDVIPPHAELNLLVHIRGVADSVKGSFEAVAIDYSAGDEHYRVESMMRVRFQRQCH